MSRAIRKSHNVSILIYHIVCPAKYRRVVFTAEADKELKVVCLEIAKRYEIAFLEIGTDRDHTSQIFKILYNDIELTCLPR